MLARGSPALSEGCADAVLSAMVGNVKRRIGKKQRSEGERREDVEEEEEEDWCRDVEGRYRSVGWFLSAAALSAAALGNFTRPPRW
jgi:hypothetical protein